MKTKIFYIILGILLLIPFISASDSQMIITCGGDAQLIIGCRGDNELFFIGKSGNISNVTVPSGGGGGSVGVTEFNLYINPVYYLSGEALDISDVPFDGLSLNISAKNTLGNIVNLTIIEFKPPELKRIIPLDIQSIKSEQKTLWMTDGIPIGYFTQNNFTIWIRVKGYINGNEIFAEKSIAIILIPYICENFLCSVGRTIYPINYKYGIVIFIISIILIILGIFFWIIWKRKKEEDAKKKKNTQKLDIHRQGFQNNISPG